MLALTRRIGESLLIGDTLVIFSQYHGDQIRIHIEAPDHTHVVRTELLPAEEQERLGVPQPA